ncbi:TMEM175 family protein [Mucilaginibacter sp. AW1-3]
MLRTIINKKPKERIKWRSHEPTRLETFSDGVFAFALTLIIVSVEVPKTFTDLLDMMMGVVSFAICFAFLFNVWNMQNKFFRRYGLADNYTILLNAILLFVSLIYVYPLKFLTSLISTDDYFVEHGERVAKITTEQVGPLMIIYAAGLSIIYFLFFLMYRNAKSQALELHLTPSELFETNSFAYANLIAGVIGVLSIIAALILPTGKAGNAGFVFFLLGPAYSVWYAYRGKKSRRMFGY